MTIFGFLCSKQDSCLTSCTHSKETTPYIALDLNVFVIIHMVQATDVYIQRSMSYTQLLLGTVNVECVAKHMALSSYRALGLTPPSVHIVFFSVLSALFSFTFLFSLF